MMKKVATIAIITVFVATGCNSQTGKPESKTTGETTEQLIVANEAGKTVHLTKQQFLDEIMDYETNPTEWIYKADLPGLVDFYADWCRPCRMTSPILEELAQEYAGQIKVYKIDVEAEKELASVFGIQSIPTFLFMPKNDKPVMSSGIAQSAEETKAMFKQQIDEILLNKTN